MSKDKIQLLSPLFLKYQTEFEKNPRSRVFAPLAETYRKLGMTDKAMEILSQGIRFHPSYLMGYLGLAFCYYDLRQHNLAYSTIRPLIELNRDNIRLQKLFSDVCLELGKKEEALETLKYLLFINPRDKDIAELVRRVEKEVDDKYRPQHKPIIIPAKDLEHNYNHDHELTSGSVFFDLDKLDNSKVASKNDFDDWMAIDLGHELRIDKKSISPSASSSSNNSEATYYDHWNIKKGDENQNLLNEIKGPDENEEHRSFHVHLDLEVDSIMPVERKLDHDTTPLVTHTLVDLYCSQGHIEKALEVLEKILLLNPNDLKTIKKIEEIQALVRPLEQKYPEMPLQQIDLDDREEVSEEDGRRHLMNLIDEKLGPIEIKIEDKIETNKNSKLEKIQLVEERLSLFLKKIQKRALDYQARV